MRRNAKKDDNHDEIVNALVASGATVQTLHQLGGNCPDILCGFRGRNYLIEIKRPKAKGQQAGKLSDGQKDFLTVWHGQASVVKSIEEALRVVGAIA